MGNVPHPQCERGRELPVAGAQECVRQPDDHKLLATRLYLDLPMTEGAELVVDGTFYLNRNGTGSPTPARASLRAPATGTPSSHRTWRTITSSLPAATLAVSPPTDLALCNAGVDSANSRNLKAGLNLLFRQEPEPSQRRARDHHGLLAYGRLEHHGRFRGLRAGLARSRDPWRPAAGFHQLVGEPVLQVPARAVDDLPLSRKERYH